MFDSENIEKDEKDENFILIKTAKTPSDVCDFFRVFVLSVMALPLRTSSYVNSKHLTT